MKSSNQNRKPPQLRGKRRHWFQSLRVKSTLFVSAIVFCVAAALTSYFSYNDIREGVHGRIQEKGLTLAQNLAYNSEYGVLILDKESLHRLTAGIAKDEDVIFVVIQNVGGSMLAMEEKRRAPLRTILFEKDLNTEALGISKPFSRLIKQEGLDPFYEIIVPVLVGRGMSVGEETDIETAGYARKGDKIGIVRVGMTLSNAQAAVARRRNVVILMTLAILAIAVTMTGFLVARVISPILKLRDMTENIAAGELGQKIDIASGGEIGELASSFNAMSKRLKETTVSKERERELAAAEHKRAEELAKSQEQLEAKTEELEAFVYTASHDLRAPLVSMEGFSSALLNDYKDKLDENGRHYLERISANVSQMSKLIQDLLELSRIGRVVGSQETIDIKETTEELKELFASQLEKRQINFHVKDELPRVKGDKNRIRQVLQNLISNAISYMGDEENPKIEVGYSSCDDKQCQLYVRDNGIGIEKEYQDQIFNIFTRLKDIDTKGTGVGLSIVKKVVEHHGGKIWIESEKGKGATFWFTLPKA
jgi:signal transduction histidine kinase